MSNPCQMFSKEEYEAYRRKVFGDTEVIRKLSEMSDVDVLKYYRNLYYSDGKATEQGIVANAINAILPEYVSLKDKATVLPCNVGDILYFPIPHRILVYDVVGIKISQDSIKVVCENRLSKSQMTVYSQHIGKTIFRTLREAEQVLPRQLLNKSEIMLAKGELK